MGLFSRVGTALVTGGLSELGGVPETIETLTDVFGTEVPPPPEPGAVEQELNQLILDSLKDAGEERELLLPYIYESMGLRTTEEGALERIPYDERIAGMSPTEQKQIQLQDSLLNQQLVGMGINPETMDRITEAERSQFLTPQQMQLEDLRSEAMTRELAAFRGELPVSPALESALAGREEATRETLARKLGSQYELTTPGIQSLSEFGQSAELMREEARRGMLGTAEGLRSSLSGDIYRQQATGFGEMAGLSQFLGGQQAQQVGLYGSIPGGALQIGQATMGALQPYQYQRGLEYQSTMQTAANKAQLLSDVLGIGGMALGGFAGK